MQKALSLFLFFLFTLSSTAQERDERTLLWRISGNGLKQPSYLYGTMHVSARVAFNLTDSFFVALDRSQVVATELDPDTWLTEMLTSDLYRLAEGLERPSSSGDLYRELFRLDALDRESLLAACTRRPDLVDHLMFRNEEVDLDYAESTFLDMFLYQAARKLGKQTIGLERMDDVVSLSMMANMSEEDDEDPAEEERRRIAAERMRKDGRSIWQRMEEAYRQHDLAAIDTLFDLQSNSRYRHFFIDERNRNMVEAMVAVMATKTVFSGVGAMHLPGPNGMIELFRARGYTVSPVLSRSSSRSTARKQRIDDMYLPPTVRSWWSSDSLMTMDLPGVAHEVPESLEPWLGTLCTDQVNGTFVSISRIPTGAEVLGRDARSIMARIDSALFEAIPGRTITRKEVVDPSGFPAHVVTATSVRGERMNYRIVVAPSEVIVVRSVCRDDARVVKDTDRLMASFRLVKRNGNNGVPGPVELPGCSVRMPAGTSVRISRPTLALSFGAVPFRHVEARGTDASGSLHQLRSGAYNDMLYLESDTFELARFRDNLAEVLKTTALPFNAEAPCGLPALSASFVRAGGDTLHAQWLVRGTHYYELISTAPALAARQFFTSFTLRDLPSSAEGAEFSDPRVAYRVSADNVAASFGEAFQKVKRTGMYRPVKKDEPDPYGTERYNDVVIAREAPEAVRVELLVHHLYFSVKDMNTYWDLRVRDLMDRNGMAERHRRVFEHHGLQACDVMLADSTTRRAIMVRMVLKEGARHTLLTTVDTVLGPSMWQRMVFDTFLPADTVFRLPVLDSKAALYLGDLSSEEKKVKDRAKESLSVIIFRDADADVLIQHFEGTAWRKEELKERAAMLRECGAVKNERVLPFLERAYLAAGDTAQLQIAVLRALSGQRTREAADLFARLIYVETPLVKDENEMRNVFGPWFDTLAVAATLFPRVLDLARFPEYRMPVYNLLAACVAEGLVKPAVYENEVPILVTEATIELKRALSQNKRTTGTNDSYTSEGAMLPYVPRRNQNRVLERNVSKEPAPDNDLLVPGSPLVLSFARILLPFHANRPEVQGWFNKVLACSNDRLVIEAACLLQRAGRPVDRSVFAKYQSRDNTRYWTQVRLRHVGAAALLDSTASDTLALARAFLFANRYLEEGDSVRYLEHRAVDGKLGVTHMYFFALKAKDAKKDEWRMGYTAWVPKEGGALFDGRFFFNWDYSAQPLSVNRMRMDDRVKAVRFMGRKRYRSEDRRFD